MLKRTQILPIGSLISVQFEKGENTVFVIVGHLTLQNSIINPYDYTCVRFPMGIEAGLVYINHEHIVAIVYRANDYENLHEDWMMRKYAEYKAYYRHYALDARQDITVVPITMYETEQKRRKHRKIKRMLYSSALIVKIAGAGYLTILTENWMVGICAWFLVTIDIMTGR